MTKEKQNKYTLEGLDEDELEICDLLLVKGKKMNKEETQRVKFVAKNLYMKLVDNRDSLLVVDWFKDEDITIRLKTIVSDSLNDDLPERCDNGLSQSMTNLLMSVFIGKLFKV